VSGADGVRACYPSGLLAVAFLVMTTAVVWGLDSKATRESLRGLTGVEVLAENISQDLTSGGLTTSQIQTDVELRLRKAGIRVLTEEQASDTLGNPYLYIRVIGMQDRTVAGRVLGHSIFIGVSLKQKVWLVRDPDLRVFYGETWDVATLLSIPPSNLRSVREEVADLVDQFINAYLAVNPLERPAITSPAPKRPTLYKGDIQQAQALLKAAGFYPGPADGTLGERTRAALRQYQQVNGLPVTGELDQATQEALGIK
jgi:hypothetical protein